MNKSKHNKSKHNKSGCLDLTAYEAITNTSRAQARVKPTEAQEQTTLFEWSAWNIGKYPELWFLHHVPNGGSRNKLEAMSLKRQGVKAGVSDIFMPVARRGYHGLYVELKAIGGRVSDNQAEWINRVRAQGYAAFVCYGAVEAVGKLEWYLGGEKIT